MKMLHLSHLDPAHSQHKGLILSQTEDVGPFLKLFVLYTLNASILYIPYMHMLYKQSYKLRFKSKQRLIDQLAANDKE